MFGYTLIVGTISKLRGKYAELFVTNFGCTHAFPMKRKSEGYESLSFVFQRYGAPPRIIVDGLKEQVEGDFARKFK